MSLDVSGNIDLESLEFVPHRVDSRQLGSDGLTNSRHDLLVHRLGTMSHSRQVYFGLIFSIFCDRAC